MANRLTIKGQVTIPKEVRDFLGLKSGDSLVEFRINPAGAVEVVKAAPKNRASESRRSSARCHARPGIDVLSLLSGVCI
ncbi:AbrB/MazE/SpoVT family DNA-binding domain-containing protein [Mesosutterella sp. OilRF-GAM-744-9]|uniref:AbrB/MazE/SpoVT family DNA-binding domain-containing protein n=2 Tax=Mesosutterella TaxID=2494213 RepID=A0ABS9MQ23_9BURK|nr:MULTISPECIES: AbrB/MazE/SpoVT family DNA-binding domain-containing protein [unclassified Mesosutterella]MCG5030711.1 AbrB/MazE/SpoVT family DNA-binding domain-containing protein [Mesosutterella sp. oilRF-744-WT-GAM-9]MDL2060471.1 AbrB/MazE/SpoVT family DNA-binding domain-containing protein [Mesosutterella sp. AGMB02718]